ncbi:unnamed protein product, partial [Adineta steineri]
TLISPSELALNDTVRQATSYTIEIFNIGNETATYNISHSGAALATGLQAGNDVILAQPLYSADYATVNIDPSTIELQPGESGNITLQFEAPSNANPALLPIFSGFICVTNNISEQIARVPYAGVVGDYKNASIIVRRSSTGIVAGIRNSNNTYISNTEQENLTLSSVMRINLVTTWSSRIVFVEVVSGDSENSSRLAENYGYVYGENLFTRAFYVNLIRNAAAAAQGYRQSYDINWLGRVSVVFTNETSSWLVTTRLPPGQYRIRFSALKHFGDIDNADDFDIYDTPIFNLIEPLTTTSTVVT